MVEFHENTNNFMKFMIFHDLGGKRARPGSREAGKPGRREAGIPGSPDPGKPGSPEARMPEAGKPNPDLGFLGAGAGPGGSDPRKPGSRKPGSGKPGCPDAGKPGSRSQILDFKGRGEISKGYLNVTGWGEASKRQLDVPPARTIRHGLYGASPFRATALNL